MRRFAVVCASGIGDALLMQIGARHLRALGNEVTVFSHHLGQLKGWFPGFTFAPQPPVEQIETIFEPFDGILLQHDNSPKARKIRSLPKAVYSLYGAHLVSKHGLFRPKMDHLFDRNLCMAENIRIASQTLFPGLDAKRENGLIPPSGFSFRKFEKRVAIHPTSTSPQKNWLKHRFLKLYEELEREGYDPCFIAPPEDAEEWGAPLFFSLSDLAAFLFESGYLIGNDSGPGHLASNLGLPTLVIGPAREHLDLWRPGWAPSDMAYPPDWVASLKATKTNWQYFVTVNQVIKRFKKLTTLK